MAEVEAIYAPAPWHNKTTESASEANTDKSILGKDDFFKILITELKYQDPLEPMKDKEFIAQMANFSTLEQMQNLNQGFSKLANDINDHMLWQQASGTIGRQVAYLNPEYDADDPDSMKVLAGVVSSILFKEGQPVFVVNGKQITGDNIVEIGSTTDWTAEKLDEILDKLNELIGSGEGEETGQ